MDQKQSQWQGGERRHAQSPFEGEDRRKPADNSIFEKTTWIPGGPVISKPPRPDDEDQQENDSQGHG